MAIHGESLIHDLAIGPESCQNQCQSDDRMNFLSRKIGIWQLNSTVTLVTDFQFNMEI